eukprot:3019974-Amphidinium_carterae.2
MVQVAGCQRCNVEEDLKPKLRRLEVALAMFIGKMGVAIVQSKPDSMCESRPQHPCAASNSSQLLV